MAGPWFLSESPPSLVNQIWTSCSRISCSFWAEKNFLATTRTRLWHVFCKHVNCVTHTALLEKKNSTWLSHFYIEKKKKSRGRQKKHTLNSQKSQLYCTFSVNYYEARATFTMKALSPGQKRWCKILNRQCRHADCPFTPVMFFCQPDSHTQRSKSQPTSVLWKRHRLSCTVHITVT